MHWKAYQTRFFSYGSANALHDPVIRIGRELRPLLCIPLVHRVYQTETSLLDQICKVEAPTQVPLCDANDESHVARNESIVCGSSRGCVSFQAFTNSTIEVRGHQGSLGIAPYYDGTCQLLMFL